MAGYGANNIRWGKLVSDADASKLPTYEPALSMGPLTSVTDSVTFASGENHGSDELQDFIEEFVKIDVDVVSTDIPEAASVAFLGLTKGEDGILHFNKDDDPPYGGVGFIARRGRKLSDNTYKKYFRVMIYPMVKGRRSNVSAGTKTGSISFTNDNAHFTGKTCASGDYVAQQDFETMAAALAFLDSVLPLAKA